jgi:hypothetical protein
MAGLDTLADQIDKSCDSVKKLADTLRHAHSSVEAEELGREISRTAGDAVGAIRVVAKENAWPELDAIRSPKPSGPDIC